MIHELASARSLWVALLLISSTLFLLSTPVQILQSYPAGLSTGTQTQVQESVSTGFEALNTIYVPTAFSYVNVCWPQIGNSPPNCFGYYSPMGNESIPNEIVEATTTIQLTELSPFTTSLYDTSLPSMIPGVALDFLTGSVIPQWLPLMIGAAIAFLAISVFAMTPLKRGKDELLEKIRRLCGYTRVQDATSTVATHSVQMTSDPPNTYHCTVCGRLLYVGTDCPSCFSGPTMSTRPIAIKSEVASQELRQRNALTSKLCLCITHPECRRKLPLDAKYCDGCGCKQS